MTTKILVVVRGGLVEDVYCDSDDCTVTLLDWDNIHDCGETTPIEEDNFGKTFLDDNVFKNVLEVANDKIQENIENDIEQRR